MTNKWHLPNSLYLQIRRPLLPLLRNLHISIVARDAGDTASVACSGSDCRLLLPQPCRGYRLSVASARPGPTSIPLTWRRFVDCITQTSTYMLTNMCYNCSYVPPALAPHFGWFKHVAKRPIPARRISRRLLRDMWSIGRHGHISAHTITHDDPHSSSNSKTPSALVLCSDDVFKSLCRM